MHRVFHLLFGTQFGGGIRQQDIDGPEVELNRAGDQNYGTGDIMRICWAEALAFNISGSEQHFHAGRVSCRRPSIIIDRVGRPAPFLVPRLPKRPIRSHCRRGLKAIFLTGNTAKNDLECRGPTQRGASWRQRDRPKN